MKSCKTHSLSMHIDRTIDRQLGWIWGPLILCQRAAAGLVVIVRWSSLNSQLVFSITTVLSYLLASIKNDLTGNEASGSVE